MVIMRVTSYIIASRWIIIADGGKVKRAVQSHLLKGLHCLKMAENSWTVCYRRKCVVAYNNFAEGLMAQ